MEENKSQNLPNLKYVKESYLILDTKFTNLNFTDEVQEFSIEEVIEILKDLSKYLEASRILDISYIKEENKINIINFLSSIEENKFFSEGISLENFEATKLLISSFIEFLNTLAPEESFKENTLNFYLKRIIVFLINFSASDIDLDLDSNKSFINWIQNLLKLISQKNLFCLLSKINLEEEIISVCEVIYLLQEKLKFKKGTENFLNLFKILKSTIEQTIFTEPKQQSNLKMLKKCSKFCVMIILSKLPKKENESFDLSYYTLSEMKNILSPFVNRIISNLSDEKFIESKKPKKAKKKSKVNKKNPENFEDFSDFPEFENILSENFIRILKILSNISDEFLINFFSIIPLNKEILSTKIRDFSYFEILFLLIKSKNSLLIAENHTKLFNLYINLMYNNDVEDFQKFQIFISLIKFLYKNPKEKIKKNLILYNSIRNCINKFIEIIKAEKIVLSVLDFVKKKYSEDGKKISKKILLYMIIKFFSLKKRKIFENLIQQNLEILLKNLIIDSINFTLISKNFAEKVEKLSFLLKETLLAYFETKKEDFQQIFELNFMKFLLNSMQILSQKNNFNFVGNLEILVKLLYISSTQDKTFNFLLNYFYNCLSDNINMKNLIFQLCKLNSNNLNLSELRFKIKEENLERERVNDESYFSKIKEYDLNNLTFLDKMEIIFKEKILIKEEKELKEIFTNELIGEKLRLELKEAFLNLFYFSKKENSLLENRIIILNKILKCGRNALIKEKIEENHKDQMDLADSDNEIKEYNINNVMKFDDEEIIFILKAFLFEFENEKISFLEKLGEFFIEDINTNNNSIHNSDNKILNKVNSSNSKKNLQIFENSFTNKTHNFTFHELNNKFLSNFKINLLKSIMSLQILFIKSISFNLEKHSKENNDQKVLDYSQSKKNKFRKSEIEIDENKNLDNTFDNYSKYAILIESDSEDYKDLNLTFYNNYKNENEFLFNLKYHLFSIFNFLKKVAKANVNNDYIVKLIILIIRNFLNLKYDDLKEAIYLFIKRELTELCFENKIGSIKFLTELFIRINSGRINYYYIPEKLEYYMRTSEKLLHFLKFVNNILKSEENKRLSKIYKNYNNRKSNNKENDNIKILRAKIFGKNIQRYIQNNLNFMLIIDNYRKDLIEKDLENPEILSKIKSDYKYTIMIRSEILKYHVFFLYAKKMENEENLNEKDFTHKENLEENSAKKIFNPESESKINTNFFSEFDNDEVDDKKNENFENKFLTLNKITTIKEMYKFIFTQIHKLLNFSDFLYNVNSKILEINQKKYLIINEKNSEEFTDEDNEKDKDYVTSDNESFSSFSNKNKKKFSKIFKGNLLIKNNLIKDLLMMDICKCINLIILMNDLMFPMDIKNQIRFSNLVLNDEYVIRSYLFRKIEKIFVEKITLYNNLQILQVLPLYFNDPEKDIRNRAMDLFGKFLNFLHYKIEPRKNSLDENKKNYNYYYKYIPETYFIFLVMYIIFNPNLFTLISLGEKQYFKTLLDTLMKLLKKNTTGNYSSNFITNFLLQLRELELKFDKGKFIRLINTNKNSTYLDNPEKKSKNSLAKKLENFEENIKNFNFAEINKNKNLFCNNILELIQVSYGNKIQYENIRVLIPFIFYGKNKTEKNKILNFSAIIGNQNTNNSMTFLNTSIVEVEDKNKILNMNMREKNIIEEETKEEWEKNLQKKTYKDIGIEKYLSSKSNLNKNVDSNITNKNKDITEFEFDLELNGKKVKKFEEENFDRSFSINEIENEEIFEKKKKKKNKNKKNKKIKETSALKLNLIKDEKYSDTENNLSEDYDSNPFKDIGYLNKYLKSDGKEENEIFGSSAKKNKREKSKKKLVNNFTISSSEENDYKEKSEISEEEENIKNDKNKKTKISKKKKAYESDKEKKEKKRSKSKNNKRKKKK